MNDVPVVKRSRGRPRKTVERLLGDQAGSDLANLDVWLMVQAKRKLQPSLSVKRACELIVLEVERRRAQADDESRQVKRREAQLGEDILAARYKAAKKRGDAKWSEADWFEKTLREFDKQHAHLLGSRTLRRCYVRAESLRQDNPFVAQHLAREFARLPGSGKLAAPKTIKSVCGIPLTNDAPALKITHSVGSIGRHIGQRPVSETATPEPAQKVERNK